MIALAIEADDKHGPPVPIANRLIGCEDWRVSAARRSVADALAEAAVAKFIGAAKEFDGKVSIVWSQRRFHGAVMLVAKGQDVRPHEEASLAPKTLNH